MKYKWEYGLLVFSIVALAGIAGKIWFSNRPALVAETSRQSNLTFDSVSVPDGSPNDLWQVVLSADGEAKRRYQDSRDRRAYRTFAIVKAVDKITSHPDATETLKEKARGEKLQALDVAMNSQPDVYGPLLDSFVEELRKQHPGSNARAAAESIQVKARYAHLPDDVSGLLDDVKRIATAYPRSDEGLRLYQTFTEKYLDAQKGPAAIAVSAAGLKLLEGRSGLNELAFLHSRALMMGKPMDLAGPTLNGQTFDVSQWKGKVVVVDFWATWCGPCISALPHLKKMYAEHKDDGLEIVGVSLDRETAPLIQFVRDQELPWPQIIFTSGGRVLRNEIAVKYNVMGIPNAFVLDRQGNIVATDVFHPLILEEIVKRQLGKTSDGDDA